MQLSALPEAACAVICIARGWLCSDLGDGTASFAPFKERTQPCTSAESRHTHIHTRTHMLMSAPRMSQETSDLLSFVALTRNRACTILHSLVKM